MTTLELIASYTRFSITKGGISNIKMNEKSYSICQPEESHEQNNQRPIHYSLNRGATGEQSQNSSAGTNEFA